MAPSNSGNSVQQIYTFGENTKEKSTNCSLISSVFQAVYLIDKAPVKLVTTKIRFVNFISVPLNNDFGFGSVRSHLIVTEISRVKYTDYGFEKVPTKRFNFN